MSARLLFGLGLAIFLRFPALGTAIYGTDVDPAYWTGSRSIGSGLTGTGQFLAQGFTIAWSITPEAGALRYTYTTTGYAPLSHLILELSSGCIGCRHSECIWDINVPHVEFSSDWGPGPGNPYFPPGATIYGVKFDDLHGYTISFLSDRNPVWGNFYAKKGTDGAWNLGLEPANRDSDNILYFIPRPDTYVIPEPGTLLLLGSGLLSVGLWRSRHRLV